MGMNAFMSDTQLELGAQTEAARIVVGTLQPIQTALQDLGSSLQTSSEGFKGGAAAGLGEAVEAWFSAAGDLLPTLQDYARNLVAVDTTEARTDQAGQERFARLAGRLGGTP